MKKISIDDYENCYLVVSKYAANDNTAIRLMSDTEGPIATLTVNIDDLPEDIAALDVNNCKFAEELFTKYDIGRPIGEMKSGYVIYPLYELNLEGMHEFGVFIN